MRSRYAIAAGWVLALPGLLVLLAAAVYLTPLHELIGCRTAGIMTIRCSAPLIGELVESLWIVLLVAASYIPIGATALLYTLGFAAWRLLARRRAARDHANSPTR